MKIKEEKGVALKVQLFDFSMSRRDNLHNVIASIQNFRKEPEGGKGGKGTPHLFAQEGKKGRRAEGTGGVAKEGGAKGDRSAANKHNHNNPQSKPDQVIWRGGNREGAARCGICTKVAKHIWYRCPLIDEIRQKKHNLPKDMCLRCLQHKSSCERQKQKHGECHKKKSRNGEFISVLCKEHGQVYWAVCFACDQVKNPFPKRTVPHYFTRSCCIKMIYKE